VQKVVEMRSHTKKGVGTAFPPNYSPDNSHRKKGAFTPHVTFHDETKVAVRLWLPLEGTRSYGIIDTKQHPPQN